MLGTKPPKHARTWMNDVKGEAAYQNTALCHVININSGASYNPAAADDIITALNKSYAELQHMETLNPG